MGFKPSKFNLRVLRFRLESIGDVLKSIGVNLFFKYNGVKSNFNFMQIKMHTQHVELSEERKDYFLAKFEKVTHLAQRLSDESTELKVDLVHQASKRQEDAYECHLTIYVPHDTLRAEAHSDSLENAVDDVIEKIKTQIERYKDKEHHISERH